MKLSSSGFPHQPEDGEKKVLNSELWHACAGPLVSLPPLGSRVVYFPQGHSEQVAASTNKEVDTHLPNYPSLPPQLICQLHDATMHADIETDEVYAQMTLQPLTLQEQKDVCLLPAELGAASKQPTNYFCKTLTASDTSTHGGFSVPRRPAEKVFPPLDYTQQPPAQELIARDLHDNEWKFRHIFRGQPKRHLLTTGWSVFVSAKRLVAGDSVIFIWNEKNQLLLGIRRANRPPTVMPSSVLSSDSMHIGLLAAAAHAASTNSRFTIFFNPRASPSEFIVPLAKYVKAVYHTRVSMGMRFRMLFETEESSVRRYMGTITGISDLDVVRWPNSHWRSVKVGWDESTAGERQPRVSLWEIEPLTTFPMYPSPFSLRLKRPWPSGLPSFPGLKDGDMGLNSSLMWLQREVGDRCMSSLNFQGYGLTPWMQPRLDPTLLGLQPDLFQAMASSPLHDSRGLEKRPNQSLLEFQPNQNASCHSSSLFQNQLLQQTQSPENIAHSYQENQSVPQSQSQLLQQSLHNQIPHFEHLRNQFSDQQQMSKVMTKITPFEASTQSMEAISSPCSQQIFPTSIMNHVTNPEISPIHSLLNSFSQDGGSQQVTFPDSNPMVSSTPLLSKRVVVEPQLSPTNVLSSLPQVEDLGGPQTRVSELSSLLPPLPGREISIYHGLGDPQNNMLFGLNVQQNVANLGNNNNESDSLSMSFACSGFPSTVGTNFPPASDMMTSSCVDESGFLQSSENDEQANPSSGTFVKVQKSGSLGRSLDISKFGSYEELRSELAHLFGLQGQLEDPLRSGWQLVFVDRENDILLLGDDPWHEFVNDVSYIKMLSPQEVQQMRKNMLNPSHNSIPRPKHQNGFSSCDGYSIQHELRRNGDGLASITSLDY